MGRMSTLARLRRLVGPPIVGLVALAAGAAPARAFSGTVRYEGTRGPVSAQRPLCICIYTDPQLTNSIGCSIYAHDGSAFSYVFANRDYYLIAFLDVHKNDVRDADEPFQIFRDRGAPPGDPVNGRSTRSDVDFAFGDENLPGAATPTPAATATAVDSPEPTGTETPFDTSTPTETWTSTGTATPVDTPTPTPIPTPAVAGDCDGDGVVSVNELVRGVGVALGSVPLSTCVAADRDGDGQVRIEELVAALNAALEG